MCTNTYNLLNELSLIWEADLNKKIPDIENVIFNDPATIVFWADGTKTVVKCQRQDGDTYSKETGLAMAIVKKACGNKSNYNNIFARWLAK